MKRKDIFILIFYFIIASSCSFYFFNRTTVYEHINSISSFIFLPLLLFIALSFYVYILVLKDRQILFFKLFITFTAILVVLVIVFELTKPNYTYNEAKGIIEKEYNVTVVETEVKSILDRDIDKEVYKITALKDSQRLVFTFNPYSKEIFILK